MSPGGRAGSTLGQAVRPTAAALPWSPVVTAGAVAVAVAALVAGLSDRPSSLAAIGGAAVASGAVAALHDPSDALLAAVPVSRWQRRLLRIALTLVVVAPAVALLHELAPAPGDPWGTTLALVLTGLAVATWLPARCAPLAAVVPLVWVVATELLGEHARTLDLWVDHPWLLAAAAGLVAWGGRHR